jgi:TolB-like protein
VHNNGKRISYPSLSWRVQITYRGRVMSFLAELRRRHVIRVAGLYVVTAWLMVQVADTLLPIFHTPDWVLQALVVLLALGFVPALIVTWVFELTPEGLKRDAGGDAAVQPVDRSRRLDIVVIVLLVLGIALFLADRFWLDSDPPAAPVTATTPAEPAAPADGRVAIAVLPFDNMSTDAGNAYFADGIAEEILNLLAGVRDLEVASRTSAFAFKGKDVSVPEIAASLKVRYVLEGSVRKAGDQVRITAQLIDAETDRHLWSDTFDRRLDDIFAVQDEIAAAIGKALEVRLLGSGGQAVIAETIRPGMYEDFLEARILMRRRSFESITTACGLLEGVVEAEPQFARGLALLAECLALDRAGGEDDEVLTARMGRVELLARRALDLNPDLASAWMILGALASYDGNAARSHEYLQRSVALDPDEPRPHHWLAIELTKAGYVEAAIGEIDAAIALEPENANALGWRSQVRALSGDLEAAIADAREQVRLGNAYGHRQIGFYQMLAGDRAGALESLAAGAPPGTKAGQFLEAVQAAAQDPQLASTLLVRWPPEDANLTAVDALLLMFGLEDLMFEHLLKLGERPYQRGGGHPLIWHPRFRALRADPRFIRVMEQRGRLELWRQLGPPPDCRVKADSFECGLTP